MLGAWSLQTRTRSKLLIESHCPYAKFGCSLCILSETILSIAGIALYMQVCRTKSWSLCVGLPCACSSVAPSHGPCVQDSAGNVALPGSRHVFVACKAPTVLCTASDGTLYCSTSSGLCIQSVTSTATPAPSYPSIKLIGQAVLGVTQGSFYLACPTPQPTNVICDRSSLSFPLLFKR